MKIEKLTAEQIAKFPEYSERWTRIGLNTDKADRAKAESAMTLAYTAAGLPAPRFVWCDSPLSMAITRAVIMGMKDKASVGASVRDSVRDSVRASVGASVWASVGDSVWASVRDSVWASVGASVWASVWASVRDSVGASVRASVWASVGASVGDSVWASVRDSVWASVGDSVGDSVRASVGASVRASVWASVGDSVWASVRDSVGASVRASVGDSVYGQHDANWLAFYEFFRNETGLSAQTEKLIGLTELAKSAGWAIPHEKICWISERHELVCQDEQRRLHSLTGPAVRYPDGWAIYAVHGARLPGWIIEEPDKISVEAIDKETNAEIRRVMIDRYGVARYVVDSGAKVVHEGSEDHQVFGLRGSRLLRRELNNDEPIVVIECRNSTVEPDGSTKIYHIRVDPNAYDGEASRNVHAAMASTWRNADGSFSFKDYREYSPAFES